MCVYDVFDSAPALELNPEVFTLTPGTLCIILPLVLYRCQTWLPTRKEERWLWVFENRALRVDLGLKRTR